MTIEIKILGPNDKHALANVAAGVFDNPIQDQLSSEFLDDPRHHLAVALEGKQIVGFASAVHYIHPDKQPELWINEVAVSAMHQKSGLGKKLLAALFEVGRKLDCREAWVLTDRSNLPAMRLYESIGGVEPPGDVVYYTFNLDRESLARKQIKQ